MPEADQRGQQQDSHGLHALLHRRQHQIYRYAIRQCFALRFVSHLRITESKINLPGFAEDEELQQQYRHLIELAPNILVLFKEALLNPEDSDRKRVLHASIDLANQIKSKLQRGNRSREIPTLSPTSTRSSAMKPAAPPSPAEFDKDKGKEKEKEAPPKKEEKPLSTFLLLTA